MKILAILPEAKTVAAALDTAEAAAACIEQASIEALHVMVDPDQMFASPEEIDLQYLRAAREGSAGQRAEATRVAFSAWVDRHPGAPVSPEWKRIAGMELENICAEAKAFDLLVVPRGFNADGADAMYTVFYCARRPFIVAPRTRPPGWGPHLTDCIVIAWNGTAACRRAVQAARPWLMHSTRTIVLLIAEGADDARELVSDLAGSGIAVAVETVARDSEKLGDQIVTRARALGATLLVMGAHRHNAWVEWVTGHTTNQALRHEDITFFMAH